MSCKKHPAYRAIRVPRVDCKDCWKMWLIKHPGYRKVARPSRVRSKTIKPRKCGSND
ncbi:MAG: hypothetical protein WC523_04560 [Patescibacteria group bacterium]